VTSLICLTVTLFTVQEEEGEEEEEEAGGFFKTLLPRYKYYEVISHSNGILMNTEVGISNLTFFSH
jgi:hypothetical protein